LPQGKSGLVTDLHLKCQSITKVYRLVSTIC
jgi:hypothetical protein